MNPQAIEYLGNISRSLSELVDLYKRDIAIKEQNSDPSEIMRRMLPAIEEQFKAIDKLVSER